MVSGRTFDYVVVGAGAAGCVLANRLSEQADVSVCLVEAGPDDRHPLIHIPAGVAGLINHPRLDWRYQTAPQDGAGGRSIALPRGRVLGGCTSTNGMVYFRGHPSDYDDWAAAGCAGWSYADLLPYFIRAETNESFGAPYHGADGPMHVSSYRRYNRMADRFVEAGESLGYRRVDDFNEAAPEGFGIRQATIRNGRRESTATAYLRSARRRPNLSIVTNALADRLLFEGKRAIGITVEKDGCSETIAARREVIVACGSFGSPALLQRSGIGDNDNLRAAGVGVLHHLPGVGENLQDHVVAPVQMKTRNREPYGISWPVLPRLVWNLLQYGVFRQGPLASNIFEATAFLRTDEALERPDIQLIFMPMHRAQTRLPLPIGHGYGILVGLLRPASRGRVMIVSPDPRAAPLIDPRFFDNADDLDPLLSGIALARRIFARSAFDALKAWEYLPGATVTDRGELIAFIRQNVVTVHHPVGTCRMGSDAQAVVDGDLRVRGIDALRVVDASIMPTIIAGNTAAPVIAIAEKAADLIRGKAAPAPIRLQPSCL